MSLRSDASWSARLTSTVRCHLDWDFTIFIICVLAIVGLWLAAALVVYGLFLHRRFGIANSLRNFPIPGVAASAVLGPGAAVGPHFLLPMPPGLGVIFGALTHNPISVVVNVLAISLVALSFFLLSWFLNRRAATATRVVQS